MFRSKWETSTSITVLASPKRVSEGICCAFKRSLVLSAAGVMTPKSPRQVQTVTYLHYSLPTHNLKRNSGTGRVVGLCLKLRMPSVPCFSRRKPTISSGQASVELHISCRECPILTRVRCMSTALQRGVQYHHPNPISVQPPAGERMDIDNSSHQAPGSISKLTA